MLRLLYADKAELLEAEINDEADNALVKDTITINNNLIRKPGSNFY